MTVSPSSHPPRRPLLQRLAEHCMVLALAGMVIAVFVNVVLRYVFNTGIASYEEISRLLFVWLVAIGAVVAAYEGSHLGFDLVTSRVGPGPRRAMFWLAQALVAVCMALLLWGSWGQVQAGLQSFSTVLGYPLALGAAATLVLAVGLLAVWLRDVRRGPLPPAQPGAEPALDIE
ncbi:TRAP-type C4-dicarboxylate transport system, small permease component [Oryzisolibacter propanilivorax]|uniref:TRAP transporter small permease protein n=1 Tax=Oryzisolibacter propanilivorax TaxID=1527607 RepID=A0A1G9PM07_9BURK|nr:TRAP transporter small permease [Oryzisolibacter propanilivorax]SDL99257.1 TRAP-type C4-dicarboxylate transport system, small permease component [Oryzisolibacter propanilivorax]